MAQINYGGIIWTNHVLERLSQRDITQENALVTFRHPDKSFPGKKGGSFEYIKYFGEKRLTLIGKQNREKEWVIISAWVDPPLPGSMDEKRQQAYKAYRSARGVKKIWLSIMRQLGW